MNAKHISGIISIFCGIGLLASAGGIYLYNDVEDRSAAESAAARLPKVLAAIAERQDASEESSINEQIAEIVIGTSEDESPVVNIDGEGYLGILSLPSINWETPIMDGWDEQRLKLAPCRYYGSPATQDLVIAGHNYKRSFGKLHSMNVGDTLRFTDMDGKCYHYVVGEIEVLEATAVQPMIDSDWDLSLYTCTYGGKQRLTVRCKEEKE